MQFNLEILEEITTLSESNGLAKKVCVVSWNKAAPVIDVRTWDTKTGRAYRGCTIKPAEIPALIAALEKYQASRTAGE